jgi:hypothetical protein
MALAKFRRTDGQAPDARSLVTLRRAALAFNAHFIRANNLKECTRVTVHCDPPRYQLGLSFHSDATDHDSFSLTPDGGGGSGDGRAIQIAAMIKQHRWLKAASSRGSNKFTPAWSNVEKLWILNIRPSFENKASSAADIPQDACGIYRYLAKDQIVYIGRGAIRARAKSAERAKWIIDAIEFSVIPNESEQEKWEAVWLDEYRNEHGVLPFHNRIGGTSQHGGAAGA